MSFNLELYRLAALARQKLLTHASQTDHDLRSLVLHANLLDHLLLELNKPGSSARVTDRDTLPTLAAHHARLHGSSAPVILVTDANADADADAEDEVESEDEEDDSSTFLKLGASPGSPPMLSHDADTDTDSDSDSDYSSDSDAEHDDYETETVSSSASVKISGKERSGLREEVYEKDSGLQLHRTISRWRLPLLSH